MLEYENKRPSDVFHIMQRISNLLDTILGSEGFTPNDVYREVLATKQDVQLIARALGETIPPETWSAPGFKSGTEPRAVLDKAREVVDLIAMAKRRAGMFGGRDIAVSTGETVTPSDVFNQVRLIDTELTEFKVFLGISMVPDRIQAQKDKVPGHVLQVLEGISAALRSLLHMEGGQA
ncbi:hypothetical protein DJ030_12140 [bacterium endosymbiont of Escarpia laminata]|nr:MAG: hypothetical protein DJ030_12140 [bacterium endosymbiont of Escarpia laminata]